MAYGYCGFLSSLMWESFPTADPFLQGGRHTTGYYAAGQTRLTDPDPDHTFGCLVGGVPWGPRSSASEGALAQLARALR